MPPIAIIRKPISHEELKKHLLPGGTLVKAVIDVEKKIMAIGGEMHVDEEQLLLGEESRQTNLWGINLYPEKTKDWIEFDSMINLRPMDNNRSRGVESPARRTAILSVVTSLISS